MKPMNMKVSELKEGTWELVDVSELEPEFDYVYMNREKDKVTLLYGFEDAYQGLFFADKADVVYNKLFPFDNEWSMYSLETITVDKLVRDVIQGEETVAFYLLYIADDDRLTKKEREMAHREKVSYGIVKEAENEVRKLGV